MSPKRIYAKRRPGGGYCSKRKFGYRLIHEYGLSIDAYETLKEKQHNSCAICKRPFSETMRPTIDHNHITEKVRGLLCQRCNTGLGHFQDEILMLQNAQAYLERYD